MCGRFAMYSSLQDLLKYIKNISGQNLLPTSYNFSPGQLVSGIKLTEGMMVIDRFKWGIDNTYNQKRSVMVNSRIETLTCKKDSHSVNKLEKCIIPANGFYEWKGKNKPYYCHLNSANLMFLGGVFRKTDAMDELSIITQPSEGAMSEIHHRMPLMLSQSMLQDWLSGKWKDEQPEPDISDFRLYPVSTKVNSIRNDSPELIKEYIPEQLEILF